VTDEIPDPHCRIRKATLKESGLEIYSFDNRVDPETEIGVSATSFVENLLGALRSGSADEIETMTVFVKFDDGKKTFLVLSNATDQWGSVVEYIKQMGWGMLLNQALIKNTYEEQEDTEEDEDE